MITKDLPVQISGSRIGQRGSESGEQADVGYAKPVRWRVAVPRRFSGDNTFGIRQQNA